MVTQKKYLFNYLLTEMLFQPYMTFLLLWNISYFEKCLCGFFAYTMEANGAQKPIDPPNP